MSAFAERFTERGLKQGFEQSLQQGREQGLLQVEAAVLVRQMDRKFGALSEAQRRRIMTADAETLLSWCDRFPVAQSPDEVLR